MSDYRQHRDVKARKPHVCDWCCQSIESGELHRVTSGRFDGAMFRQRMHFECSFASQSSPCSRGPDPCGGCENCYLHWAHPRGGYTIDDRDGNAGIFQVSGPILAVG